MLLGLRYTSRVLPPSPAVFRDAGSAVSAVRAGGGGSVAGQLGGDLGGGVGQDAEVVHGRLYIVTGRQ